MSKLTGQIEAAKSKMFDITKLCSKHREYRRVAVAYLDAAFAEATKLEGENDRLIFEKTQAENHLYFIDKDVAILWKAVQKGIYDSRSIVGDHILSIAEELEKAGLAKYKTGK